MFRKSQRFYDAIYAWKDYPAEVDRLLSIIRERVPEAGPSSTWPAARESTSSCFEITTGSRESTWIRR